MQETLVQFLGQGNPLEKTCYPLQNSRASPVVSDSEEAACNAGDLDSSLGWEDPPEEGMATHSSILTWRIPMDKRAWQPIVHGVAKSWTLLSD